MSLVRLAPAALALCALGGCAEIDALRSAATPSELYTLSPKSTFGVSLPQVESQIVVEEPTAAAAVNTDRIAVKPDPLVVQYYPAARWTDRAPLMIQRLLVESFENTDKVGAVGVSAVGLRADYTLILDLREFQAVLPPVSEPETPVTVITQLNIKIIREPEGVIVGSRSFPALQTAESAEMLDVVEAFDDALGDSMRGAVEWTLTTIDAQPKPAPRDPLF